MSTTLYGPRNGVDVDQLVGTIEAVQRNPEIAHFQFRSRTDWVAGGHSRTSIQGFYGGGREDDSRVRPFVLEGDEPPILLGSNLAPNAVEAVLHALGSCLAVGFAYNAAARGINISSLCFELEGDLDLHGFLGLSHDVRAGCQDIRVVCRIESDAPRDRLEELAEYVQRTSPVLDLIRNPVPVTLRVDA